MAQQSMAQRGLRREESMVEMLGGEKISGLTPRDVRDYAAVAVTIRRGLPVESATWMRDHIKLEPRTFYQSIIPRQTLESASKRSGRRLSQESSERLYRAARVYALADEAFGDRERAERWLGTPNPVFHDQRPVEYLDTEPGAQWVEVTLNRMMHGIDA